MILSHHAARILLWYSYGSQKRTDALGDKIISESKGFVSKAQPLSSRGVSNDFCCVIGFAVSTYRQWIPVGFIILVVF
jgi:hypothetical protein